MSQIDPQQEMQEIAARLQLKWLRHMEFLIDSGELTAADRKTLYVALKENGWQFDPSRVPQGLKDKLTSTIAFDDDEDDFHNLRVLP
jgi:hypothetical protein